MRRFQLHRNLDISGISGTGLVAEGVEFSDGRVAVHWLGDMPTTTAHDEMSWVEKIHGHQGATEIRFLDEGGVVAEPLKGAAEPQKARLLDDGEIEHMIAEAEVEAMDEEAKDDEDNDR